MTAPPATPDARPWPARFPVYYGWVIVAIAFTVGFFNSGQSWVTSVFVSPMQDELGWSRSAIYGATAVRGVTAMLSAPFVGGLADRRYGARGLLVFSGVVGCISVVAASFVHQEWEFLFWFGLVGGLSSVGQGFLLVGATVPKWFVRKRGSALAWASLAGGASAFVMPPVMTWLIDGVGWRSSWLVLGVVVFLCTVLPAFIIYRQPEDVGLLPDGEPHPTPGAPRRPSAAAAEVHFTLGEAVRTRSFWVLAVGLAAGSFCLNGLPASIIPIYTDRGFSRETAAWAFTLYGSMSTAARFFWGYLADKMHIRRLLLLLAGYGVAFSWTILVLPGVAALLYAPLAGFCIGGYVSFNQAAWPAYYGRTYLGAITGVARPLAIISSSAGPIALAAVYDGTGSYDGGFLLVTLSWAVCFAALWFVRPVRKPVPQPVATPPDGKAAP